MGIFQLYRFIKLKMVILVWMIWWFKLSEFELRGKTGLGDLLQLEPTGFKLTEHNCKNVWGYMYVQRQDCCVTNRFQDAHFGVAWTELKQKGTRRFASVEAAQPFMLYLLRHACRCGRQKSMHDGSKNLQVVTPYLCLHLVRMCNTQFCKLWCHLLISPVHLWLVFQESAWA